MEVAYLSGNRGSVRVHFDPCKTSVKQLQSFLEKVNPHYRVREGDPETVPPLKPDIDFRVLSRRGAFQLDSAFNRSKRTLFLFLEKEDWNSLLFETKVDQVAQEYSLAVRLVYLGDRVAREQFQRDFPNQSVPHLRLYDETGQFLGKGDSPAKIRTLLR